MLVCFGFVCLFVCLFLLCLFFGVIFGGGREGGGGLFTSQQHGSVSQGRFCSDKFTCCHTEIEVADQTFYLTQSQNTDTGSTSPSADPIPYNAMNVAG